MDRNIWKPKKSCFDWGKSEYKVIKNWNLREKRQENVQKSQDTQQSKQPEVPTASIPNHEYKIVRNWSHREERHKKAQNSQETEQAKEPEVPAASISRTVSREYETVKNWGPKVELSARVQDEDNRQSQEEVDGRSGRQKEDQSEESSLPSSSDSEIGANKLSHGSEGQKESTEKVNTSKTFSRGFSGLVDMEDGLIQDSGHSEAIIPSSGQNTVDSSLDVTGHAAGGDLEPKLMEDSENLETAELAADKDHVMSDNANADCQSNEEDTGRGKNSQDQCKSRTESVDARQASKKRRRTERRNQEVSEHVNQKNSRRQIPKKTSKRVQNEISVSTSKKDSECSDLERDAPGNTRRKVRYQSDADITALHSRHTRHQALADTHQQDSEPIINSGCDEMEDENHMGCTRKTESAQSFQINSAPTDDALPNREMDSPLSDSEPTASENDAQLTKKTVSSFSHQQATEQLTSSNDQALIVETDASGTPSHSEAIGRKRRHQQDHPAGESVHELWIPKRTKRGPKDLNELDVCLSLYDRALRDTRDDTSEDEVKKALQHHWKLTHKQMFTIIKDVQGNHNLVKKCKKERAKSSKLQKLLSSQLAHLRKSKERSRKASAKVSKTAEAEKMDTLKAKIQTEANELRPLLLKLFVM